MATSVNFFQPGTEGAIDYGQIQRQRALAEMLQKQGMTPQQGQMVSGHYVAPSPLSYVAQLASVLAGKHKENQADEREQTLLRNVQAQRSKEAQDFMTASNGTPAVPGRSIAPLTPNDDEGNAMPSADVAGQAAVAPDRNRALAIALQSQNPTLQGMGGKMMERQMDAEELRAVLKEAGIGQPAAGAAPGGGGEPGAAPAGAPGGVAAPSGGIPGIDPRAMALTLSRLPQAQKLGGMIQESIKPMPLAEGGTAYIPGQGPVFTAPKTEAGIGVQGGVATPVPGFAEAQARREALQAQARQQAESQETLVQVPTPQGIQTMTRAQATQYLRGQGGGAPAPARPGATGPGYAGGSASAAAGGQMDILSAELGKAQQEFAAAQQRGDAAGASRAQSDMAGIQREMGRLPGGGAGRGSAPAPVVASAASGMPGIAGPDPNAQKFGETVAGKSAEALMESRDKAKGASDALLSIQQARETAKSGAFQGSGADFKQAFAKAVNAFVPGVTIDPAKVGNTDYLKSTLGGALLEQAKALGSNPSNADANRINDIVGTIGTDPLALTKMLDWREAMAKRAIEGHNAAVDDAEKRGLRSQMDLRVKPASASSKPGGGFRIIGVQ